jgi:Transposase
MPNGRRWVGLDVDAHASAVAVFDDATGEVITCRVTGRPMEVLDVLRELPGPVRAVYEAGPTGYGLVRRARIEGIEMAVCSPGNIERRPGDRTGTDKRDAIRLARPFAAGDLRLVWVPGQEQEQLRDLVGCREDLRADLMRARHRPATLLWRRERSFPGAGRPVDAHAPPLALTTARRRPGVADHLRRRSARPRRAAGAARPRRPRARAARPGMRVGRDDRAHVLPAGDQHRDRARAVRRDR